MSSTLRSRIVKGLGAHSVGMGLSVGIQLASLPLFLSHWDTATYGVWLMLSAMPGYLTMADVGMVSAAGNRMTMAVATRDIDQANRVFHSAQVFMALVCGAAALLCLPLIWWSPWPAQATPDQRLALMALVLSVLLSFAGGLSEQVFKATQRYPLGTLLGNAMRLAEWLGWMAGLFIAGSFLAVAVGGLLMRLLSTLWVMQLARRDAQGLRWGVGKADRATVHSLLKPALGFMAFPLGSALSLQGMTLLVGAVLGPVAVAVFNTYRTLARTAVQVTAMFSFTLWPEFSRLYGQGAVKALHRLAWRSTWLGVAQAVLLSVALFVLAPRLLQWWTHGAIGFDAVVLGLMLAYAAVAGLWHVPRVLLMATNQHTALALWSLAVAATSLLLAAAMGEAFGLAGIVGATLAAEAVMAAHCMVLVLRFMSTPRPVPATPSHETPEAAQP